MAIVVGCSSNPQEDPLAFCQKFLDIASPDAPLNNFDFDEPNSVTLAGEDLTSFAEIAPAAISEEVTTVTNLYIAILQALVSVSANDRPSALLQFQKILMAHLVRLKLYQFMVETNVVWFSRKITQFQ